MKDEKVMAPEPGWRYVTADEWADFTSDYHCYQTERHINKVDTMVSRITSDLPNVIDIAYVHYLSDGTKIYAINEKAIPAIKYYLRNPHKRSKGDTMSIGDFGTVSHIPEAVIAAADTIKLLNYKTTTPAKFRKNELTEELAGPMLEELADIIGVAKERLDYVYFSCCRGAEPHTDLLPPERFGNLTYIVPVILPPGANLISVGIVSKVIEVGGVYGFNHETIHSLTLEDNESGCVVIMIAVKHPGVK